MRKLKSNIGSGLLSDSVPSQYPALSLSSASRPINYEAKPQLFALGFNLICMPITSAFQKTNLPLNNN
jgi:hypothetical protein